MCAMGRRGMLAGGVHDAVIERVSSAPLHACEVHRKSCGGKISSI